MERERIEPAPDPADERPRRSRRLLRIAAGAAILLFLVALGALLVLQTSPARRWALSQLTSYLRTQHLDLQAGSIQYSLTRLRVTLRDVVIRSTDLPTAPPLARIGSIDLDLGLRDLIGGRYTIQGGAITDADVQVVIDEQGETNLPQSAQERSTSNEPLDYLIEHFAIINARLRYQDRRQQLDIAIPLPSLTIEGDRATRRHHLVMNAGPGALTLQGRRAEIERIAGDLTFDRQSLQIKDLALTAEGSTVSLAGNAIQFNDPRYDVALTAQIDVSRLATFVGVTEPVGGTLRAEVRGRGPFTEMAVRSHLQSDDLRVRDLSGLQLSADTTYDVPTRQARLVGMTLNAPFGRMRASGAVSLDATKSGDSLVSADLTSVDLARLAKALHLPYAVASRADGYARAKWKGLEFAKATGDARLALAPTAGHPARGTIPVAGTLIATASPSQVILDVKGVRGFGATADGRIAVADRRDLRGTLHMQAADIAAVVSSAEAWLGRPQGTLVAVPVAGALESDITLGGTISTPTARVALAAPNVRAGDVTGVAVTADASYAGDDVTLHRADVAWRDARAHAQGRVGLAGARPFALEATVDRLPIAATLTAAGRSDVPASGTVSLRASADGTVNRMRATMNLRGTDLAAYGETLGTLSVDAGVVDRQVQLTSLRLDKPQPGAGGNAVVTARGTYDLDSGAYDGTLTSERLRLSTLTLSDGSPVRGALTLRAAGRGTVKDPAGTASIRLTELHLRDHDLGTVTVDAQLANQRARVKANADKFHVTADADLSTNQPYATTATVQVRDLDLTTLPFTIDEALAGTVRGRVDFAGPLNDPRRGTATVTLEQLAAKYNGQPIATDGTAVLRYADDEVTIDRLVVRAQDSTVSLRGRLPIDPRQREGAIDLDARFNLSTLASYAPPSLGLRADGDLSVTGNIRGTLQRIDPTLTLTIGGASISTPTLKPGLSGVAARIDLQQGEIRLTTLQAAWGQARLSANGVVPFSWLPATLPIEVPRPDTPARLHASLVGLDLATLPGIAASATTPPESPSAEATPPATLGGTTTSTTAAAAAPATAADDATRVVTVIPSNAATDDRRRAVLQAAGARSLGGLLSIEADIEAPRPDVSAVTGKVTFPDLRIETNGLTLAQQGVSTIVVDRGVAQVEHFTLDGTAGRVDLSGRIGFLDPRPLDVVARANVNAAAINAFTSAVRVGGRTTIEVAATGTLAAPLVRGFAELQNGRVSLNEPRIAAQGLAARIDFTPTRATLTRLDGTLNGGTLSGSGGVDIVEGAPRNLDLKISAGDVALDTPMNMRSVSKADLHLTQREDTFVVGGQVTIQEAGLTEDINLDTGLFAFFTAPPSLDLTETRNPMLERVRFDIRVNTASPILIDNNLARAEIDANLRVMGTPYETGLSGRMDVAEGSELTLNERHYEVQRGVITFIDDRAIRPSLDLQISTNARKYDVNIQVTGTPDNTETTLTSSPTLPEPDILSLLLTGRTLDELRGEEFEVAQTQVLSYLGGRVGTQLGRGLQKATGLSTVRVEPTLIANEEDPGARLTVGQDLTPDLSLVYSTDLVNSSDQVWIAEYDVTRQFVSRAVRQSDASYRFDFRHDVRFGGTPEPQRMKRERVKVASLSIAGTPVLPEKEIRDRFKLEVGDNYDFFKARRGLDRLAELYRDRNRLQARMRLDRNVRGKEVDLTLRLLAGPTVTLAFEGFPASGGFVEDAKKIWQRGVFDAQREEDVVEAIRAKLIDERYFDGRIEPVRQDDGDIRLVTFRVTRGEQFSGVRLAFDGAQGLGEKDLRGLIHDQKLGPKVFSNPVEVTDVLTRVYRERGYLAARIDPPMYEVDRAARIVRVIVPVHEGPRFIIRRVQFAGTRVFAEPDLLREMPLVAGEPYLPSATEQSLVRLRQLYWSKGYNDMRPSYALALDRDAGFVDVTLDVQEGQRSVIASIDVAGGDETSQRFVRGQIEIKEGEPLDLAALGRSRRNLYDTGAFSLVDITREDVGAAPAATPAPEPPPSPDTERGPNAQAPAGEKQPAGTAAGTEGTSNDKPVKVEVAVREVQPFQIRYGALFDTERGPGGILDIANHNSLGKARVIGLSTRYDSQVREGRLYFSQPSLRYFPMETIASIYARQERNPATSIADAFNVDRVGVSIQQERKLRNHYVWQYGYRFERSRTYEPEVDAPKPPLLNVSPVTSTVSRETRDDVLDATTGSFISHAFSYSPTWLGSDRTYIKYFGQYFTYVPLQGSRRKQFTNEILRPRFVYAVGVRAGLARGLADIDVPLSERFLAGGSTTLRGFAQNAVGPIGPDGVPRGGQAMFVLNNELRFPLFWIVDGVGFVDVGNVFDRVRDFQFNDLRESAGIGARLRTPWFLVRIDYGIPLDRKPGEAKSRAFFSIGQAF